MTGASRAVVCIAHSTGAGGEEIGHLVASGLGFRYVDEEILTAAAEKEGLEPRQLAAVERRREGLSRLQFDLVTGGVLEEMLRALIRLSISETAAKGGVVIVAHAAAIALADDPRALRVLVTGSLAERAQRLATQERIDAGAARKLIERSDKGRAAYLKRFYGIDRELPIHYDLVVNTDRVTPDRAAALVTAAAT
jgi:cytidylate kinase